MRRLLTIAFSLALISPLALAGDGCPMGGGCPPSGGSCSNPCPLAQDANGHRSTGEEAVFSSKTIRADYVKSISKAIADL